MNKLSAGVQSCVNHIIASENFIVCPIIEVSTGSKIWEGFTSKTFAIDIRGINKTIHLFVKYLPEDKIKNLLKMYRAMFQQEIKFYNEIYPAMVTFQKKWVTKDIFDNVPKYYHIEIEEQLTPPVILENVKYLAYSMRPFKEAIDGLHLNLVFKTYAKFHAISYAMKYQQPELFQKLTFGITDLLCEAVKELGIVDHVLVCVERFLNSLDPIAHKNILEKCVNLGQGLIEFAAIVPTYVDKYAVICHGDSWSNNIMFRYDHESGLPIDIKLIDFQEQKLNSPVLDLVYFFYTVATKNSLDNFDYYCDLYYNTLAKRIEELGTDPNEMYPRVIFNSHWKKFAKFGLAMAFFVLREQLQSIEEIQNVLETNDGKVPLPTNSFSEELIYHARMIMLVQHFIERDFL